MLHILVPLYRQLGIPVRWAVIDGDDRFFDVTKRLGNLAYGSVDPADRLDPADVDHYLTRSAMEAKELLALVGTRDLVLLHDHQTAALVPDLAGAVRGVFWRCHVGVDAPTAGSRAAWDVLAPLLERADAAIFSIARHIPERLPDHQVAVIPPVIWPYSPKNEPVPRRMRGPTWSGRDWAASGRPATSSPRAPGTRRSRWSCRSRAGTGSRTCTPCSPGSSRASRTPAWRWSARIRRPSPTTSSSAAGSRSAARPGASCRTGTGPGSA
ncbi:hypothetical protein ACFQ9X_27625 [Catenulispora yoronensis]